MARAAAKKGVKRTSQETNTLKESKKTKVDRVLEPVVEAIDSSTLPETCKAMLRAALPNSLCVASDLRGPSQVRIVNMLEEVIEVGKAQLQSALDTAEQNLEAAMASTEEMMKKVQEKEAGTAATKDLVSVKKVAVAEAQAAVTASCEALRTAQEAQKAGDAPLDECEARCREVKAAIETLKAEVANEHPESFLEILRQCDASEALLVSMPAILAQAPAQRSAFENMAVTEAEKFLAERVAWHTTSLEEGAEAKKNRAVAVLEAEHVHTCAKTVLEKANGESLDAEVEHENAVEGLRVAKEGVLDSEREIAQESSEREKAKAQLDRFVKCNVASFDRLRTSVSTDEGRPATAGA